MPFLSPGDLPNLGIEPTFSTLQVDCLPLSHQGFWHLSNLLLSRTHHSSITSASLGVEMRLLDVFKFPSDSNMDPSLKTIQVLFFFFLHVVERWHRQLNGHEFEQTLGDGEGQGSLAWFSPWGCKELDTTE